MAKVTKAVRRLSEEEILSRMKRTVGFWRVQKWLAILIATVDPCPAVEIARHTGLGEQTIHLPFRARRRVGVAIFPSMPRVVPHSVILPRCLEGLNVFCFVFFSYLSPAAYGSGKSARNKVVAQFSRKNGTSIGSTQDR